VLLERMVSYASNREDVVLRRAFAEQGTGFFIEIGACNPVHASMTKYFSDRGWCGVNVEPIPSQAELFRPSRPRDVTVCAGISDRIGETIFYEVKEDVALSTFSERQALEYQQKGHTVVSYKVPLLTLAELCERHVGECTIDFLCIDVEGHERAVLLGADFRKWRPRVLIIEATKPWSTEPTHQLWEDLVFAADYQFGLFDGLNRFYVRLEDADRLLPTVSTPANILDNYVTHSEMMLVEKCRQLEQEAAKYREIGRVGRLLARLVAPLDNGLRKLKRTPRSSRARRRRPGGPPWGLKWH
jgi:FkbM family methyltransferase